MTTARTSWDFSGEAITLVVASGQGRTQSYRAEVARYVIDAPTLLHLVAEDVYVSSAHQLVAPNLIRSQALSLLLAAVRGDCRRRSHGAADIVTTRVRRRVPLARLFPCLAVEGKPVEAGRATTVSAPRLTNPVQNKPCGEPRPLVLEKLDNVS